MDSLVKDWSVCNNSDYWCNHTGCVRNRDGDRDHYRYYTETFHIDSVWDRDWSPESHWNTIKTHHLKQFQDLKNG